MHRINRCSEYNIQLTLISQNNLSKPHFITQNMLHRSFRTETHFRSVKKLIQFREHNFPINHNNNIKNNFLYAI